MSLESALRNVPIKFLPGGWIINQCDRPQHTNVYCDRCQLGPIVGTRYRWPDIDCDLCEDCVVFLGLDLSIFDRVA